MDAAPVYRCRICSKTYKRLEHLRRHSTSHREHQQLHQCLACGRSFARTDALRRHLKTCPVQHDNLKKPSRRRACNHCVQTKKACDLRYPCQTCQLKDLQCSYSAANNDQEGSDDTKDVFFGAGILPSQGANLFSELFSFAELTEANDDFIDLTSTSWNDFLNLLNPSIEYSDASDVPTLHFLDNFTKQTGLINSFDCGDLKMRQDALEFARRQKIMPPIPIEGSHNIAVNIPNLLSKVCEEIICLVKEVATIKPRNSAVDIVWSEDINQACLQFFNPEELRKNIELYWTIWHPNVNIIHRPTFEITSAKPVLVAAMATMGAILSPEKADSDKARKWFNSVEEIVFIDDDFCDESNISPNQIPPLPKIQTMQAAYIVCLYQNWEGSSQSKRRIRRHRFNALVSTVRDIHISNARHDMTSAMVSTMWHSFAAREQLIRVIIWVFLLDTAFVIFNNLPPRMVITEMTMDLASCDAVFQAYSSDHWWQLTQQRLRSPKIYRQCSLYQAAEILCADEIDEANLDALAQLGPLNLFAVTSSLHSMLFQYQHSFNTEGQQVPLRNALQNWKLVWTKYLREKNASPYHEPLGSATLTPENMWKRIGFMRHAAEYWLLASLLLDRICRAEHRTSDDKETLSTSLENQEVKTEQTLHPLLKKYDETSMQQVNDLIADFQRASIN